MRRFVPLTALSLAVACGADSTSPPVTPPNGSGTTIADVFTPGNVFSPFSTTITVGGTVRFNISGVPHNVIFNRSQAGAPADVNLVNNVVVSRTFATRGTFPFDCTVHQGMSGQVVVQ